MRNLSKQASAYGSWTQYLDFCLKEQEKIADKIKRIEIVVTMRKKNKASIEEIGKRLGISKQAVSNFIKKYNL